MLLPFSPAASFTRLARRAIGQPFYGWLGRNDSLSGRFNGLGKRSTVGIEKAAEAA